MRQLSKPETSENRINLCISAPLSNRARRAANIYGYRGEREFSEFICMVIADWLNQAAAKRKDKDFPEIQ